MHLFPPLGDRSCPTALGFGAHCACTDLHRCEGDDSETGPVAHGVSVFNPQSGLRRGRPFRRGHCTIKRWGTARRRVSTGIEAGLLATERPSVCTTSIITGTESPKTSEGSVTVSVETPAS